MSAQRKKEQAEHKMLVDLQHHGVNILGVCLSRLLQTKAGAGQGGAGQGMSVVFVCG